MNARRGRRVWPIRGSTINRKGRGRELGPFRGGETSCRKAESLKRFMSQEVRGATFGRYGGGGTEVNPHITSDRPHPEVFPIATVTGGSKERRSSLVKKKVGNERAGEERIT